MTKVQDSEAWKTYQDKLAMLDCKGGERVECQMPAVGTRADGLRVCSQHAKADWTRFDDE